MSKQHITSPEAPRRAAISCVVATATAAVALAAPTVALAEEPTAAPPTTEPSATTATAEAPSATAPYTTTQTVAKDEKTFPTKDDAQAYLDNAKATWAETDKKDTTSTYKVTTTGPEKVDSTTTSTTTTVKDESKEFDSQDEADNWRKDNTSGYQNTGDATYDVKSGVDKVESGTTEKKNGDFANGEKDGLPSEQAANDWINGQTKQYKDTADTTYSVDSTVTPKENSSKKGEKDGEATTQEYGPFDSEEAAEAARATAKANDPGSILQDVTFKVTSKEVGTKTETVHVEGKTFYDEAARDSEFEREKSEAQSAGYTIGNIHKTSRDAAWGGKYDYKSTEYPLGANSFAVIKQADWYAIWTPEQIDNDTRAKIEQQLQDKSLKGELTFFSGFDTRFTTGDKTSGEYWVTKNDDGSYTMHVNSADKISHLDYGTLPTYSYSFDMTRQTPILKWYFTKTVQNYKPAVEWSAKYTVSSVTKVPTYTYKAWYKVTKTENVTTDVWKAGYEVVKTTTFTPPVTPPTTPPTTPPVTPPTTPKTPEAPKTAVQKATVRKQAAAKTVAKAAVPKTSDSTNLAGAGILAGLAVAFGAAGIALRRRTRKLD
ncbi:hypothetical protein [Parafannyhessea umbonata]|uniref:LPXTG cell wall anchor domain-containing protein n=1 Tax=Parafannyhessea umbonata TaxID=604330 RepID=A0A6N7WRF4_9ACTN|nr:hypothetical protein [Parafannyhessea umbonata]MST59358.1 hypothetical protein [Parafannyhessea umbonata]